MYKLCFICDKKWFVDFNTRENVMGKIKEYLVGNNSGNKIYFVDSNILLNMCQYYYRGKCDDGVETTEEIKKFILRAREGIQNKHSIIEISYDYVSNSINVELMNKVMIAYDNLIMNMSENELISHKGSLSPNAKWNSHRNHSIKSIFDCKLPEYLCQDDIDGSLMLIYEIYVYFLYTYKLYFSKWSSVRKIEELFKFMTEEIDVFLGYEFYLAVLLFLGKKEESEVAKGVLKPCEKPSLDHILNAVIDIYQYREVCLLGDMIAKENLQITPVFVTMDGPLKNYIEHNISYNRVISEHAITPVGHFNVNIKGKYIKEWNEFYLNRYYPCVYERYMGMHRTEASSVWQRKTLNMICQKIKEYEKQIIC